MKCSGTDAATGRSIEISFDQNITNIHHDTAATTDLLIASGFVDIQVNGFSGIDFNNPVVSVEDVGLALDTILHTGVTRFLPTVITGGPGDMLACLQSLRRAQTHLPSGRAIAGFHIEGPAIGMEDGPRGAHPARWVRPPSIDEFRHWQDATDRNIRLITLSPHWPEAPAFIRAITADGVAASIGHTGASSNQIHAAVEAGATLSTHLGNGAHQILRRHPNYIWDQLAEDRLSASFIVDGIHLGQAYLQSALRAKTTDRAVLVTDASAPAGAPPGRYRLGEQDADLTEDGRVVLAGTDKLAGSALQMNDAVANAMRLGGVTLADAIRMATVNPARIIHLEGRTEGLSVGQSADLTCFRLHNGAVEIDSVYLDGERVA